jgi:hypothetical protein
MIVLDHPSPIPSFILPTSPSFIVTALMRKTIAILAEAQGEPCPKTLNESDVSALLFPYGQSDKPHQP